MPEPPETCSNCGADLPLNAKACPECGADDATGWSEQARYDGLDLPDENFDYNDFVKREFAGGGKPALPRGVSRFWWMVAFLALAGFVALFVLR
jgi:hypothetical protein